MLILILLFAVCGSLSGNVIPKTHLDDSCSSRDDGLYPISDVFKYLECKSNKGALKDCPDNQIFEPGAKSCVDALSLDKYSFCANRSTGDWRDPWDCHSLIKCYFGATAFIPCQLPNLVFDPYLDQCVYPQQYSCKQVSHVEAKDVDDPCKILDDGIYGISDVFSYMQCKNHVAKYISCLQDNIFDAKKQQCVSSSDITKDKFCTDRTTGNFRNPWNCHGYISCVHGSLTERPCAETDLVYDPYRDLCEYEPLFSCKEIKTVDGSNPCDGKGDGNYPLHDVFRYLTCKDGEPTYNSCPAKQIFDPPNNGCIDITKVTFQNFCSDRADGDWANPFNCHGYILCEKSEAKVKPCLINGFVFNPYLDVCVQPSDYECKQANNGLKSPNADDPCKDKKDGVYSAADMFSYLQCKSNEGKILDCAKNMIFDSDKLECINASKLSLKTFCEGKKDGIYQDLWDCHAFVQCVSDRLFVTKCQDGLVYDPYFERCEHEPLFRCRQLDSSLKDDVCKGKKDGDYPSPDFFMYLTCKSEKGTYTNCPTNQVYDHTKSKCVAGSSISKDTFCKAHPDGDYQNPWDCHTYLSCSAGRLIERPCAIDSLVYDPFNNLCEYESLYACKSLKETVSRKKLDVLEEQNRNVAIKDICTTLPDGYYATRNVLAILECKDHVSVVIDCPDGHIYIPGNTNCTDAKDITEKNFCENRGDGNWQDPFNCHNWFTCHAGQTFNRPCNLHVLLNYDPDNDLCEYPSIYPCKNVTTFTKQSNEVEQRKEKIKFTRFADEPITDDPCAHLADGIYAIPDISVVMHCKNHVHTYQNCPDHQIYVPGKTACTPIEKINAGNFCSNRQDGNWRNPWNCHRYVTCHAGYYFDRPCSIKAVLNYNPYADLCEFPFTYGCSNITAAEIPEQRSYHGQSMDVVF